METQKNKSKQKALDTIVVSDSFVNKFINYQNNYELFLMWCMDNNGRMTLNEWNTKKAIEFKRRGLHKF